MLSKIQTFNLRALVILWSDITLEAPCVFLQLFLEENEFSHHSHNVCDYNPATTRARRVFAAWSAKKTSEHAPGVAVKEI
ncbi:hypothetical protein EVAR_70670_1, partial [Eumeta japonica]